jgi:hypothetical protein
MRNQDPRPIGELAQIVLARYRLVAFRRADRVKNSDKARSVATVDDPSFTCEADVVTVSNDPQLVLFTGESIE